jgi:hypothetical protein
MEMVNGNDEMGMGNDEMGMGNESDEKMVRIEEMHSWKVYYKF